MVGVPKATPVTVKLPPLEPEGIRTLGVTVASVGSLLTSVTVVPLTGAGPFRVMVPVAVRERPTGNELGLSVIVACVTFTTELEGNNGGEVARTLVLLLVTGLTGVTVTSMLADPNGMTTLGGILTTAGLADRLTVWPLPPAANGIVTVNVPGAAVVRLSGFGDSVMPPAVIITVERLLSVKPSLTFSWAT
jgi:hypothetical protein